MAFRTRRGKMTAIRTAVFSWTLVVIWLVAILQLPPIAVAALGVWGWVTPANDAALEALTAALGGLSLYTYVAAMMLFVLLFEYVTILSPSSTFNPAIRAILRSRVGGSLSVWVAVQTLGVVALVNLPAPWAWGGVLAIGVLTLPLFAVAHVHTIRTRRQSIKQPLLAGFDDHMMNQLVSPKFTIGPGHDFPKSPGHLTDVKQARYYANMALDRQTAREHVGMVTRVVAGAFIATVTVWAITSGTPGGVLLGLVVVLIMYGGHLIEIRGRFYGALAQQYSDRADEIELSALTRVRWWQRSVSVPRA
ncbi:MAG: hypothetical protein ACOH1J_09185 [Microbacteriaceae bacterium]